MDLDTPLLRLSATDFFTIRDACQSVSITGGIGSGKTSGPGQALAGAYLRAGMGGLVLCAKPEEAQLWRDYARRHGRAESLIEFDGRNGGFNFIDYELARHGPEGLNTVVECLLRVMEAARLASASPGQAGASIWESATRQALRNTIPMLYTARGRVAIPEIIQFVRTAPQSIEELRSERWRESSFMFQVCVAVREMDGLNDPLFEKIMTYWASEYAALAPETRGSISLTLTATLDRFNYGWMEQAFCGETTLVPELCFHGAIILLNMPALTLNEDGIVAQQLFKYMWQRAVLARNALAEPYRTRPVFLWADEAQYFVNSYDAEFQSTCRGSRACTVYLSQSLPTYYAKLAGEAGGRDRVHHLLGNFATKIFTSNACAETNEWAARTIGRALQRRATYNESEGTSANAGMSRGASVNRGTNRGGGSSASSGPQGGNYGSSSNWGSSQGSGENWGDNRGRGSSSSASWGHSEQMDYLIEPAEFGRMLKTGGPANANRVSAVWYQAGRTFERSGGNALLAEFQQ